jgi:hypothetical protein
LCIIILLFEASRRTWQKPAAHWLRTTAVECGRREGFRPCLKIKTDFFPMRHFHVRKLVCGKKYTKLGTCLKIQSDNLKGGDHLAAHMNKIGLQIQRVDMKMTVLWAVASCTLVEVDCRENLKSHRNV